MHIKEDNSYLNNKLIALGYAEKGVYSLNFDRYLSDEEVKENRKQADLLTRDEWEIRCDKKGKELCQRMEKIMKVLQAKYKIYQYTDGIKYGEHDLFFYSNRGWNGKEWYDHIRLSFNDKRTKSENMKLYKEVLELLENMEVKNVHCRIQYETVYDNEKLHNEAVEKCKEMKDKFVSYNGMIGKIKQVGEGFGFFKKKARTKYYPVNDVDMVMGAFTLV